MSEGEVLSGASPFLAATPMRIRYRIPINGVLNVEADLTAEEALAALRQGIALIVSSSTPLRERAISPHRETR